MTKESLVIELRKINLTKSCLVMKESDIR
jgi:hypothetical protein